MIDKENEVFTAVSTGLRKKYKGIYIVGTELATTPPRFPAVSLIQTNNSVRSEYSTFYSLENVVKEDYKAEVYSNLEKGKEAQTKEITMEISDIMQTFGYERTFCEPIANIDATVARRVSRFIKNNVT
jgi:hypothetical protein